MTHLGKTGYFDLDEKIVHGINLLRCRPNQQYVLPKYISSVFKLPEFIEEVQKYAIKAANQASVNTTNIKALKVPLPPKDIQEKIIGDIEKIEKQENDAKAKINISEREIDTLFLDAYEEATDTYRLSDSEIFYITIGKRVLTHDLVTTGGISVYSANVLEPFGKIDKLLMKDFSVPSVLWGIDGDWMVNYIPEEIPFYPTDHCGVLRVLSKDISPKYVAWVLHKEGVDKRFSRQLRASIDRITGISIKVPSVAKQKEVITKVEELEQQVTPARKFLETTQALKADIIKKHL